MDTADHPTNPQWAGGRGLRSVLGLVAVVLLMLLVGSLSAGAELQQRPHAEAMVGQVQSDGVLAFDRQCAGCHGVDGQGGIAPDLRLWTGSIEETESVIAEGAPGMPAFAPTLTGTQIEALAAHLDRLVGVSVYARECAGCHGAGGDGGIGPSLKVTALGDVERRAVITDGAGSMPGFESELSDAEIEALVWRTGGYASVGATLFATQCAPCHGAAGEGITGPPLLGLSASSAEVGAIVTSGFGGMPAFGSSLNPGDIEAIVQFALSLEAAPTTTVPATTTTTQALSAIDIYSSFCASCHGVDAEGGIGPTLVGLTITDDELRDTITSGQGSMPPFSGALDDAQVDLLIGFVQSLATPSGAVATEAGADLYATQCAACHGVDGRGGLGPSLRTTLLTGAELRAAISNGNATMPAFGQTLGPAEIDLAVGFVEWLKQVDVPVVPLRGGSVIYRQDCSACHGEQGEGGIGPSLQATPLTVNDIISQVYGGHSEGMPAFAGALDGQQVRDVAHFIKTFELTRPADGGWGIWWWAVIGTGLLGAGALAWFLFRIRRRNAAA